MSALPSESELSWLGLNKRLGLSDGAALFNQIEAVSAYRRAVFLLAPAKQSSRTRAFNAAAAASDSTKQALIWNAWMH